MRRLLSIAAAAGIVVTSFLVSPNFRADTGEERLPYAGDFLHEYVGGYIVRVGDAGRLYDRAYYDAIEHDRAVVGFRLPADRFIPMVYPPVYYLIVSPLSSFPYRTAARIWAMTSLSSFALAVWLLGTVCAEGGSGEIMAIEPRLARVREFAIALALPAAVAFVPFAENLVSSQKATFMLLALTGALVALRRGHLVLSGLALGALALKPQLAIVIPAALLAKRQWGVVLGVVISGGSLALVSIAMGHGLARQYWEFATTAADYVRFGGYVHRLHGLYGFWTLLGGEPTLPVRLATLVSSLGVVVLVARLLAGPLDLRSERFLMQFAGLVLATLVLSPHLLTYDLTLLLLPLGLVGWAILHGALPPRQGRALLWLGVGLYVACGYAGPLAVRAGFQVTTPLMVALLGVLSVGLPDSPSAR